VGGAIAVAAVGVAAFATAGSTDGVIVGTTVRTAVCATADDGVIVGTTVRTALWATAGSTLEVAADEIAVGVTVVLEGAVVAVISTLFTSSTVG